jgi:hypothetical protein
MLPLFILLRELGKPALIAPEIMVAGFEQGHFADRRMLHRLVVNEGVLLVVIIKVFILALIVW